MLGEGVSLEIDGRKTHRSYLGALFSVIITVLALSYAIDRFDVMWQYGDTVHQQKKSQNEYTKDNPLSYKETTLDFAVGLQTEGNYDAHFIETHGFVEYKFITR